MVCHNVTIIFTTGRACVHGNSHISVVGATLKRLAVTTLSYHPQRPSYKAANVARIDYSSKPLAAVEWYVSAIASYALDGKMVTSILIVALYSSILEQHAFCEHLVGTIDSIPFEGPASGLAPFCGADATFECPLNRTLFDPEVHTCVPTQVC